MALASRFRRVFTGRSNFCSQFASLRLNSTLTFPKLFISGLSRETTDDQFKEAFNPFGQIVEAKIIRDRATGRSKGFGFVTYTSMEEAEKAREEMNATFLHGWAIFVDPAKPR
ncbi:hypothetical protein V6N13_105212 [Hibiscus sabdariffa]|uniref:Uncharacterized protein n=2 Tax=Hibiscus sabdariffa TaxID=183260 RepID=A0ABR2A3F4_9ROSI